MESIYELVKDHVNEKDVVLVRTMIIEALMKIIPEEDYRAWLHVKLINVYAQENLIKRMQSYINDAFNRNTRVVTKNVMLAIITTFFRCNAVEELAKFVKQAESARWRICRSLYHCKMGAYTDYGQRTKVEQVVGAMFKHGFEIPRDTFSS
ncbi:hypothetical protein MKW92_041730 [Papaver armeniacum]|nr:hypothetical protein MKW92_041730 [Papaver armeniacum]